MLLGDFWVTQLTFSHLHIYLAYALIPSARIARDQLRRYSKSGKGIVYISARHRMVLKKSTGKGSTADLASYLQKVKLG